MKNRMLILILFLSAVIMSSCMTAQQHLRKAIKMDPSILETVTTIKHDTVEIPSYDSVFIEKRIRDSILVAGDTVRVELRKKGLPQPIKVTLAFPDNDSMYLDVDCPDIVNTTTTVTETLVVKPTFWQKAMWVGIGVIISFATIGVIRAIKEVNPSG